jgi:MinD-like ATPase involved in chromosome partitioning or flagellar assembly
LGEIPLDNDWPFAIAKGKPIYITKPNGPSAMHIRNIMHQILPKIQQHMQ